MSEWITDRLPTAEDAVDGHVLITTEEGIVDFMSPQYVKNGEAWQRTPAPYVKPKRWALQWSDAFNKWIIKDIDNGHWHSLAFLSEDNIDAAQRILDIYNEVMP
jgi:hypothetical protein